MKYKLCISFIHLSNGGYFVVLGSDNKLRVEQLGFHCSCVLLSYFNCILQSIFSGFNIYIYIIDLYGAFFPLSSKSEEMLCEG